MDSAPVPSPKPGDLFAVKGLTVLITGATSGIGLAITEAFAAAGAHLILASNDEPACHDLQARLTRGNANVTAIPTDVRNREALERLVFRGVETIGEIDVLICNAGISGPMGSMASVSDESYDELFRVNLRHAWILSTLVAPRMAKRGMGSIVVTSSIAGLRGNARIGVYAMTKAALSQLVRNLSVEFGPRGVRANAVAPGLIRTGWASALLDNPSSLEARLKQTPLRRIGEPWEVAAAALFLASPASGFITGQTLVVDGGTTISDGN